MCWRCVNLPRVLKLQVRQWRRWTQWCQWFGSCHREHLCPCWPSSGAGSGGGGTQCKWESYNSAVHRPFLFSSGLDSLLLVQGYSRYPSSVSQKNRYCHLANASILSAHGNICLFYQRFSKSECSVINIEFLPFLYWGYYRNPNSASENHKYRHIGHRAHSVCCEYLACFELCLFCPQYLGRSR